MPIYGTWPLASFQFPTSRQLENHTFLQRTSVLRQLASVQDEVIEGMTIELMVAKDTQTENTFFALGEMANAKNATELGQGAIVEQ
jgi:hypothetical protein